MAGKPQIIHTATPAGHGSATSHASRVNGQWLSVQAQEAIANMRVHRAFDDARDPLMAKQLADADRGQTEAERRGESDGGGQKRRRSNDNPTVQHGRRRAEDRPRKSQSQTSHSKSVSPAKAPPVDRDLDQGLDSGAWLRKQHNQAMANLPPAPKRQTIPERNNAPARASPAPRPSHGPSM